MKKAKFSFLICISVAVLLTLNSALLVYGNETNHSTKLAVTVSFDSEISDSDYLGEVSLIDSLGEVVETKKVSGNQQLEFGGFDFDQIGTYEYWLRYKPLTDKYSVNRTEYKVKILVTRDDVQKGNFITTVYLLNTSGEKFKNAIFENKCVDCPDKVVNKEVVKKRVISLKRVPITSDNTNVSSYTLMAMLFSSALIIILLFKRDRREEEECHQGN